jgi:hypothetical protein
MPGQRGEAGLLVTVGAVYGMLAGVVSFRRRAGEPIVTTVGRRAKHW